MKILLIHNSLNDSRSVSGVLKHYALMAKEWIARGHETDFLIAKAGFSQLADLCPQAGRLSSDDFFDASSHIEQTWRYLPAYVWRLFHAHFQRFPKTYDVIYASNFLIFEVYPAHILARRSNACFVVKLQHLLHAQPNRKGLWDKCFLLTERLAARIANHSANLMMCLSECVKQDYQRLENALGLHPSNLNCVGCGLDFEAFDATPFLEKKYDVVFLGRMHEQKGVLELSELWQIVLTSFPDAKLLIIGEGPHRHKSQKGFRERGIDASANFVGGISEREKNHLLAQSRIGLSLSYEEGWGLSATEYLASGIPVVAYDLPVFRNEFQGHLHLCPTGNVKEVAKALIKLMGNQKAIETFGKRGREFVRRFDYRLAAEKELALMQEAVKKMRQDTK